MVFRKNRKNLVAKEGDPCYFGPPDMKRTRNAFTLIEMLIVIAIISVLAAMAISSFANAAKDSREVLVAQQAASVQEAVSNWAAREIGRVTAVGGNPTTMAQVRAAYNGPTTATTASEKFALFSSYLDEPTRGILSIDGGTGRVTTDAMRQTGSYLELQTWAASSYPKVHLVRP